MFFFKQREARAIPRIHYSKKENYNLGSLKSYNQALSILTIQIQLALGGVAPYFYILLLEDRCGIYSQQYKKNSLITKPRVVLDLVIYSLKS